MLVFKETSSGKYYRETRAIKYSEDARRRRDATLSNFQALPFARPILITFRVLKRNYLGPSPPAPPAPPSGNEARWKNKRKALSWGARCLCASQIWPISKRCWCNDFFLHFREHSVHERLLSEKQLKHGRVISTPARARRVAPSRPTLRLTQSTIKQNNFKHDFSELDIQIPGVSVNSILYCSKVSYANLSMARRTCYIAG